jgi:hypothetical protein
MREGDTGVERELRSPGIFCGESGERSVGVKLWEFVGVKCGSLWELGGCAGGIWAPLEAGTPGWEWSKQLGQAHPLVGHCMAQRVFLRSLSLAKNERPFDLSEGLVCLASGVAQARE